MGAGVGGQLDLFDGPAVAIQALLPGQPGVGGQEGGDRLLVGVPAIADLGNLHRPVHREAVHNAHA